MDIIKNIDVNNKSGRRLAGQQVETLKEAIGLLLNVIGYVDYEDEVDQLIESVEAESVEDEKNFDTECNENCFGFKVLQGNDEDYLLTWTTNAYEDREGETFSLKSIEDYVERNVDNNDKGTYQFWHVNGSDFADIIVQGVFGKFLVEAGRFRKDEIGQTFKEFFLMFPDGNKELAPYGWGCSHGYTYRHEDRLDAVYEWFDKVESTVLPLQEAANLFTLAEFGEKMKLSDKQKEAFDYIGEATKRPNLLQKILGIGKRRTEMLDEAGVESKQAVLKTDDGVEYPASCYAYVPDKEQVSTWKLRMCAVGTNEITREQLGAASAAFSPGGFRGQKVQIPEDDVSAVKKKLRDEYKKLGVENDDIPESIKAYGGLEVNELVVKMQEAAKSMHEEMRKKVDGVLVEMEKAEADQAGLLRQLAEIVANIDDEELKAVLEELIAAMQEMLKPAEESEEEVEVEVDEAMVEEPEEVVEKSLTIEEIADGLELSKLSELLEIQQKSISENAEVLKGLPEFIKGVSEKLEALDLKVKELGEKAVETEKKTEELEKEDEKKVAEKQAKFTPFWGSGLHASKAAETVLNDEQAKNYAKPEVPSVIANIGKSILGGRK